MLQNSHKCIRDCVGVAGALGYVDVEGEANLGAVNLDPAAEEPRKYPEDSEMVQSFGNFRWGPKQDFPGDDL